MLARHACVSLTEVVSPRSRRATRSEAEVIDKDIVASRRVRETHRLGRAPRTHPKYQTSSRICGTTKYLPSVLQAFDSAAARGRDGLSSSSRNTLVMSAT